MEERYDRQTRLAGFGQKSQEKLSKAKVLIVGVGGLGSPASIYLAATGIGELGIIDSDKVELINLPRQIIYTTDEIGKPKAKAAAERLLKMNPEIKVTPYEKRVEKKDLKNYDLVLDCTDNIDTRYFLNDACVELKKPLIYGAIFGYDGQVMVIDPGKGPCLRCIFPSPPPAELVPPCSKIGVFGPSAGLIGVMMATEAIKVITGIGTPLAGKLLAYDPLQMSFRDIRIKKNPDCPVCRD